MTYAKDTAVPPERTLLDIKAMLEKNGATAFVNGEDLVTRDAYIEFLISGRRVRLIINMPPFDQYQRSPGGRHRNKRDQLAAWEQGRRQRWRQWWLVIKGKLEAVDMGVTTLDREFMPDIVLPDNKTVGEWLAPQLEQAYASGRMPPMLMAGSPAGQGT